MDILKQLEKEVYIADYNDLGAHACRIIVPDYVTRHIYKQKMIIQTKHNFQNMFVVCLKFIENCVNMFIIKDKKNRVYLVKIANFLSFRFTC